MKLVIDSSNNDPIDEKELRSSGAVALIGKGTEGTSYRDQTLASQRAAAKAVHIPFGSYLFLHPDSRGSEAAYYLDYAKPKPGDIQPIIDAEVLNLGIEELSRRVLSCSNALRAKGYDPLLYVSAGVWGQLVALQPHIKSLRVWEAQYPRRYQRWFPYIARLRMRLKGARVVLWQWTDGYAVGSRHFDASALLVPLDELLIPQPKAATGGGKTKLAA